MKLAVMQPAFIPPASYFRLLAACDQFIFLDNVQFDKRWYTHRQKLYRYDEIKDWFTLPIKKKNRDTTMIKDLEWSVDAMEKMQVEERRFMIFKLVTLISDRMTMLNPMAFIIAQLDECLSRLQIPFPKTALASSTDIPKDLRGQDRIIALCKKLDATEYINSPGGRDLYEEEAFDKEGIRLTFLPDYAGNTDSMLERLQIESPEDIRREIHDNI